MKKIQFFIFCIGIVFLSSCANPASENSESSNAKLTAIHNFSSYKGIGVGTPNVSGNSSARTIYSDDDLKLIGQKGDGSIEVITFDDESGAEQKQTYHLSCYTNRNSFIFMGFSDYKTTRIESDALYNHTINYILDKKTGKLYSLDFNSSMFDIGPEFDGKIIIGATINNIEGMYFFSIQDNLLKIELIADYETIPVNSYSIRLYTQVDRYGNFFTNENEMRRYIITKSGRIKNVPYDFNLCVNGIFYNAYDSDHITHWIDENGECVTATYIPTYYFQMKHEPHEIRTVGRLDKDTVGSIVCKDLFQSLAEVSHETAADTARVHFGYLNACVLKESAVNAYLTELVLDKHQLFALVALLNELLYKSGLSCAQKARENSYFCHVKHFFLKNRSKNIISR